MFVVSPYKNELWILNTTEYNIYDCIVYSFKLSGRKLGLIGHKCKGI